MSSDFFLLVQVAPSCTFPLASVLVSTFLPTFSPRGIIPAHVHTYRVSYINTHHLAALQATATQNM
jgi:hypothetical protein